ncbi:MAG: DUF992 domain-containing protein [Rhizobiales bacterium]|mgnify:CR=1 FL=1|nr:DUF992 domain-containing protein [Hyphomicrobiales bacterium]MBN9009804.1 DUF992 domain-containing protein [Hyphomicrobiales bacterium]
MRLNVLKTSTAALGLTVLAALPASADGAKIGVLECHVKEGVGLIIMEKERMTCKFTPVNGNVETYYGQINEYGLAVGVTAGTIIIWGVIAANTTYQPGTLAGKYVGISAEASVGLGVGANALIGGSNKAIALQPVSVQGQVGVDIAVGITDMDLVP